MGTISVKSLILFSSRISRIPRLFCVFPKKSTPEASSPLFSSPSLRSKANEKLIFIQFCIQQTTLALQLPVTYFLIKSRLSPGVNLTCAEVIFFFWSFSGKKWVRKIQLFVVRDSSLHHRMLDIRLVSHYLAKYVSKVSICLIEIF